MIILNKNTANSVVLTLTEKTTLPAFIYIVEFISEQDKESYFTQLGANQSTTTDRYDEFVITEKTTPNVWTAEIELAVGGYQYRIYEVDSGAELSAISDAVTVGNVIEYGKAVCKTTAAANTIYSDADSGNVIYGG